MAAIASVFHGVGAALQCLCGYTLLSSDVQSGWGWDVESSSGTWCPSVLQPVPHEHTGLLGSVCTHMCESDAMLCPSGRALTCRDVQGWWVGWGQVLGGACYPSVTQPPVQVEACM